MMEDLGFYDKAKCLVIVLKYVFLFSESVVWECLVKTFPNDSR